MLGLMAPAWAQFPFYDIETFPVCYDSAGTRITLQKVDLYALGRNDIPKSLYFDNVGTQYFPADSLLFDGPCYEYVTDTIVLVETYESSLSIAPDTIPENTYDLVSINNIGYTTHTIDVQGGTMRLLPGERYLFAASFDEKKRQYVRNPRIIISQGTVGINNMRVYMERK